LCGNPGQRPDRAAPREGRSPGVPGRVRTINGPPQLAEAAAANLKRGVVLLSALLFAADAKRILLPFHRAADLYGPDDARRLLEQDIPARGWEVITVHMMGTARMGNDRTTVVTSSFGLPPRPTDVPRPWHHPHTNERPASEAFQR